MNIVLLSGGSGKRLWPLSNEIRSKQFLKLFNDSSKYESMVQRVYRQIKKADPYSNVVIATSKSQISSIHNQLGNEIDISIEPSRRDTFPAIALATFYMYEKYNLSDNDIITVCPVDPYVDDTFFSVLKDIERQTRKGESNLVLMGIVPTYPSEKYGYIIPKDKNPISNVISFKEKPCESDAQRFISEGALWNGGVFSYKIKYVLEVVQRICGVNKYKDLFEKYDNLEKISFDYAVVEKEKNIQVVRFEGQWMDVGTWNTLTDSMSDNIIGDAIIDDVCKNVHVINELDVPIIAMGVNDLVIASSPDGILVADKERSCELKKYVDLCDRKVMFAEKSWGSFKIIDAESESLTIKVEIDAGDYMNYHSHDCRDEVWIIIGGIGRVVIEDKVQKVSPGDVIKMRAGCKHTIIAETKLKLIEVQIGNDISVLDKYKYPFNNEWLL